MLGGSVCFYYSFRSRDVLEEEGEAEGCGWVVKGAHGIITPSHGLNVLMTISDHVRSKGCDPFPSRGMFLLLRLVTWYVNINMFSHGVRVDDHVQSRGKGSC